MNVPTVPTVTLPQSPRLAPLPVFHPETPAIAQVDYVDNHNPDGHAECCLCYEMNVEPGKTPTCGHAICADCTQQLRKAECPTCRRELVGGYLTQDAGQAIQAAAATDARVLDLVRRAKGNYVAKFPERVFNRDPNLSPEAEAYGEAFSAFIEANPTITDQQLDRLFDAFIDFVQQEEQQHPLTLEDAVNEFSIIGLTMLDNPTVSFDQIYAQFAHTQH